MSTRFRRLLVATDLHVPADNAFEVACSLAERLGAAVTLLHVHDGRLDLPAPFVEDTRAKLEALARGGAHGTVAVAPLFVEGSPHDVIMKVARDVEADMIVLGLRDDPSLSRLLRGSISSTVVRRAGVPVLCIPYVRGLDAGALLRTLVVGTDLPDSSQRALMFGAELSCALAAHLVVVHAYDVPIFEGGAAPFVPLRAFPQRTRAVAGASLEDAVRLCASIGADADAVLREGAAWDEVRAVARERSAGLIIVGTHGRRGVRRALLGSVAERIVRSSDVPVATVRDLADDAPIHLEEP